MVGLPRTGKTTFLAAFYHAVESEELELGMRVSALAAEREYLNRIREDWQHYREMPRTPFGAADTPSIRLEDVQARRGAEVFFPDLSGEWFERQWTERHWPAPYGELAQRASGALLFLHPERIVEPLRIEAADDLLREWEVGEQGADVPDLQPTPDVPWDPSRSATQVQMVELLQFLRQNAGIQVPFPIAIIVSAWDVVLRSERNATPITWLGHRLPLLSQYLYTNSEAFPSRVFGISAIGGDLRRDLPELRRAQWPSERIRVIEGKVDLQHDITAPVRWLMNS
jgi:hypothetical protein